ncbi:MAG: hypothetical protein M3003_08430 [Candidatus Dormibacteraeota bacterium]|nr:hypothetical protein [Candidatus Dormibacteraeota bacterium]
MHIAARVAASGGAGQVLLSSTVKDLVAGSGIRFTDLGVHALKGIRTSGASSRSTADVRLAQ